jgi:regulator of sirC expression with transglutaminase-like and TPR domain
VELSPPSDRFLRLAAQLRAPRGAVALADAAFCIAAEFDPGADETAARAELERLGARARSRLCGVGGDEARVAALLELLHGEEGFHGNEERYDDARNSFLPDVVARRTGIPITLAIVCIEVAARAGFALCGISFPAHFLVRTLAEPPIVIDPFLGVVVEPAEIELRLQQAMGREARLSREWLAPATPREIAVRMLNNLKNGYVRARDWTRAIACCDRLLALAPELVAELRDRGLLYEQLECFGPALADLESFLAYAPATPDAGPLRERVEALRARVATIS